MALAIYNSLTRTKVAFEPLKPGEIAMYVCGPTVYDEPHIGHARSAYIFEVIRRYLVFRGYQVRFVRNVTDVDDKIIDKARKEYPGQDLNVAFRNVSQKYLDSYHRALDDLGIGLKSPDIHEPRASEYIGKMVDFIRVLIERKVAYPAGGDVYFDITKAKNYGKLSNQSPDKMESGSRVSPTENKRNPLDFALWKSAKENEPFWESPWGRGRPGWHIECSAMSSDILGDEFDIHGGGIDLIFPHHENEVVQSEGAGKRFARYWIHHGLLTINGQKMAKSLGNFVTIEAFLSKYRYPELLKLFFLSTHYAHPIDYTEAKIEEAKQALERIGILFARVTKSPSHQVARKSIQEAEEIKSKFEAAMDDNFNTPQALASIFDLISIANKRIDDFVFISEAKGMLQQMLGIFALEPSRVLEISVSDRVNMQDNAAPSLGSSEIQEQITKRGEAKKKRDFREADRIRNELEAKGVILEDTKDGTTWRRKL